MRTAILPFLAVAGLGATPALAQTAEQTQAVLVRHANSRAILLSNGASNGSWLMERPVTGMISARACFTDFAAPRSTRLVNVNDPANHMAIDWSSASNVVIESGGVRFDAPWVGAGNFARLLIADPAARAETAAAMVTLIRICNPQAAKRP